MGLLEWGDTGLQPPREAGRIRDPRDNGLIEAFNGRLRAECLNEHRFLTLGDAQAKLDAWREHYNGQRPHGASKNMTPEQFAQQASCGHPQHLSLPGDS